MKPQELNLLVVFDAIMTEESVTKAAERLNTTQPAVSNAIAKMRHVWKDQLFIKHGRNIQPTSKARDLWSRVRGPLQEISDALDPGEFIPSTSDRIFRIAAIESITALVWAKLKNNLDQEAPNLSLHTFPYKLVNGERMLKDADVDMVIAASNLMPGYFNSRPLFEME